MTDTSAPESIKNVSLANVSNTHSRWLLEISEGLPASEIELAERFYSVVVAARDCVNVHGSLHLVALAPNLV